MANVGLIRFGAFFFGLLAVIFLFVATPTHHWYVGYRHENVTSTDKVDIFGGIFEDCFSRGSGDEYSCSTPKSGGYIKATKVFMILAIVGFAVLTTYLLVMAFTRGVSYKFLAGLIALTGFFTLIGVCIYTNKHTVHDAKEWRFSWSFALGWTSCVFTFIAAVFAYFGEAKYDKI